MSTVGWGMWQQERAVALKSDIRVTVSGVMEEWGKRQGEKKLPSQVLDVKATIALHAIHKVYL